MTLVVPNNGEGLALANFLNKTAPQDQSLRLYQNNITPAETDTAATYTVATFTGYANKALTGASWTVTEGAPSSAAAAQQTFTSSADQTLQNIYGYYVVQTTSGIIMWAERFTGAPFAIQNNLDAVLLTPVLTMD
jgi:hypothetical protein